MAGGAAPVGGCYRDPDSRKIGPQAPRGHVKHPSLVQVVSEADMAKLNPRHACAPAVATQGAGGGELTVHQGAKDGKPQTTNQQKHETGISKHTPAETIQTYRENCAVNHERTNSELYERNVSLGHDSKQFNFEPGT